MKEIEFTTPVAYKAKSWRTATGLQVQRWETVNAPSPNGTFVLNLTPVSRSGLAACEIEIPIEQIEEVIAAMRKVAQPSYDEIRAAKDLLVANGYVDFFVSSEEVRAVATDMQRELSNEEVADLVEYLSHNDLETGLCALAIEGAISELCPEATDHRVPYTEEEERLSDLINERGKALNRGGGDLMWCMNELMFNVSERMEEGEEEAEAVDNAILMIVVDPDEPNEEDESDELREDLNDWTDVEMIGV